MGLSASGHAIDNLSSNEHLQRLSGHEALNHMDPFWNQLLSFSFQVPRTSEGHHDFEESTAHICKNFAINNCRTGNFGALIKVFLTRALELKESAQCENNIFIWQTYNAVFIIRNLCKYFVENLSEEVVIQQFETRPDASEQSHGRPRAEKLINCLIEVLVDVPVDPLTYALHVECLNTLLTLLAIQMYQPITAGSSNSKMFQYIMQGKCSIHACVLMKTLLTNFIRQEKCPAEMRSSSEHGMLYGLTSAVASGLWTVMTLGMARKSTNGIEDIPSDNLLANQSLLLILVLSNHCTMPDQHVHNPYREALFSFTNVQESGSNESTPVHAVATFKVDFTQLYQTLCSTLREDQTTLLLYMLLHKNLAVKQFILSRTNLDHLVLPLLKILYGAQDMNSHHIYMSLIVILILSEDDCFNKAIHEMTLKNVVWFKERIISEISLGGLLVLIIIRTIQYNLTKMRDKYLHTSCLAALANMSAHFKNLHSCVSQRLVSLFALLVKKHTRIIEHIRQSVVSNGSALKETVISDSIVAPEVDYVQELAAVEEVMRMVLEIINSCLSNALHHNPNLVYTLLYDKELFEHFSNHAAFQDIIHNIDVVLSYFTSKLEQFGHSLAVPEASEIVRTGVVQFRRDRLRKFPALKFQYVEEEQPEEFFVPYVWSLVYDSSDLYFNPTRILLFAVTATC